MSLLTAGQAQLKAKLLEARPMPGDRIRVTFDSVEKRGGGKTLKHFTVQLKKGGAKTATGLPPNQGDFDSAPADPVYGDEEPF